MALADYARCLMRTTTTLQLDDDVLAAALVLARQRRRSVGVSSATWPVRPFLGP